MKTLLTTFGVLAAVTVGGFNVAQAASHTSQSQATSQCGPSGCGGCSANGCATCSQCG